MLKAGSHRPLFFGELVFNKEGRVEECLCSIRVLKALDAIALASFRRALAFAEP
jgi:hypothetical protein